MPAAAHLRVGGGKIESKIENIKSVTVEKVKQKHKDEVLENKHKDLFDELFGDKS